MLAIIKIKTFFNFFSHHLIQISSDNSVIKFRKIWFSVNFLSQKKCYHISNKFLMRRPQKIEI